MWKYGTSLILAAALGFFSLMETASSQEGMSTVPAATEQIQDQVLRDALRMYSPNYDSLSRGEQINAFTNIYKVLNDNRLPPLTAEESQLLSQTQAYLYAPPATTERMYDPWGDPTYNPWYEEWGILRPYGPGIYPGFGGPGFGAGIWFGGGGWGGGGRPPPPPPPGGGWHGGGGHGPRGGGRR